MAAVMDLAYGA